MDFATSIVDGLKGAAIHGFEFEVAEVERCIAEGLVESPMRRHEDTPAVMDRVDAVRGRCGISYPDEESAELGSTVGETVALAVRRLRQDQIGAELRVPLVSGEAAWLDAHLG